MNPKLKEKISESLSAVLPITLIVLAISVLFVPLEISAVAMFVVAGSCFFMGVSKNIVVLAIGFAGIRLEAQKALAALDIILLQSPGRVAPRLKNARSEVV